MRQREFTSLIKPDNTIDTLMWRFYAVRVGKKTGIFEHWHEAKSQVHQHPGAVYGAFNNLSDAEAFMKVSAAEGPKKKISNADDAFILTFDGQRVDEVSRSRFVIKSAGGTVIEKGAYRLNNENTNEAKYHGLIEGLNTAISLGIKKLLVKGDGPVVIKQVNGSYKINDNNLNRARQTVIGLTLRFDEIEFVRVHRREITDNDMLFSPPNTNNDRDRDRV